LKVKHVKSTSLSCTKCDSQTINSDENSYKKNQHHKTTCLANTYGTCDYITDELTDMR